ncbi:DUF1849 family protein [Breoghania sp. L-A4]|uniref:EipB family protein n=1 Tax=Breoghania sp. L-A4 TaxID=2304600 RepID=UPI000E35D0EF|nr:DUF1849 family protein [Breoghania sp. L-A4]AXS40882.1 DUF1849 family protein [Breoghania sp. L-A4]
MLPHFVDCRASVALTALSIGLFTSLGADAAQAGLSRVGDGVALTAHRAVYDLSLDEDEGSGISALSGRIVFESVGNACDGYSETLRFVTRSHDSSGKSVITDLQSSTFEFNDAFDFVQRTLVNGQEMEDIRGRAERSGAVSRVDLERPSEKSIEIEIPVLFPNEHMRTVIAAARKGEHFVQVDVFDGSENGETVSPVTTVIGEAHADATDPGEDDSAAVGMIKAATAWPVVFSYFDANSRMEETGPAYQMSGLLYDNGIMRKLHFDYGSYSINGRLAEIEFFDEDDCRAAE